MSSGRKNFDSRRDRRVRRRNFFGTAEGLEPRELLALFQVTSVADSGTGSLREAITQANSTAESDTISFQIDTGAQTISLSTPLPAITGTITLDGTTQPGFDPSDPKPIIEIDGSGAGASATGLDFQSTANGSIIKGLAITGFSGDGIRLRSNSNIVQGNYIGVGLTGNTNKGNGDVGLEIDNSSRNSVGGTAATQRNVISGNGSHGIRFSGLFATDATLNRILGNYIGTDASGTIAIANGGHGVDFFGGGGNFIGGSQPGEGNLISGNDRNGINFFGGAAIRNVVQGNKIGTNAAGTAAIGNEGPGIFGLGNANTVGGNSLAAGNLISGNRGGGVSFQGNLVENGVVIGNVVQGNRIGTDVTGTLPIGNTSFGVRLFSDDNLVGGPQPGQGNIIAFSNPDVFRKAAGVTIILSSNGNSILGNSIFGNVRDGSSSTGGLGIDFNDNGTPLDNDPLDTDSSQTNGLSNDGQNYPIITSAETGGGVTIVNGTLNSAPLLSYRIELFSNPISDPSNHGEGQVYLGSTQVTTNANGDAVFQLIIAQELAGTQYISATATELGSGNTSEFSLNRQITVLPASDLTLTAQASPNPVQVGQNLVYSIAVRNNGPAAATAVQVELPLPVGAQFVSATNGGQLVGNLVTYTLPSIPNGGSAILGLTVRPTVAGTITTEAAVTSGTIDPTPGDNRQSVEATVVPAANQSVIAFSSSSFNVSEGDGGAMVTVTRSNGTSPVSVQYAVTPGTASANSDFTPVSGTLSFAEGELVKTINVAIVDDFDIEGNETVNLALSNPQGNAVLALPFTSQLVIQDDDPNPPPSGRFRFSGPSFAINEGAGVISIPVERVGGASGEVRVDFSTSDGTASANVDYQPQAFTMIWSDGDAAPKFVMIRVNSDSTFEPDETINLVLSNAQGAPLGGPSTAVLTIVDDDPAPVPPEQQFVQFSAATYATAENAGLALVAVSRSAGNGTVSVRLSTSDGTAIAGQDYVAVDTMVTFAEGETSKIVQIPIFDDTTFTGNTTVNLTLSTPEGGTQLGTPSTAVLTIIEDEAGPPQPPPNPGSIVFGAARFLAEEENGVATINIIRTGGDTGRVTVNLVTRSGTATPGIDYTPLNTTLTFEPGQTNLIITIPLIDDSVIEGPEYIGMFLESPTGGATIGAINSSVLEVIEAERDTTSPIVLTSNINGSANTISSIQVTFSEALDPVKANNPLNYIFVDLGRDGRPLTGDERLIPTRAVGYDPVSDTVTVVPDGNLTGGSYQLIIPASVPAQVSGADGNLLDGDRNGLPGGDFSLFFARATSHSYVDNNGDRVNISLTGGGTLDLIRKANGDAEEVRIINPRAGRSLIQGSVRKGPAGDGLASIERLIGIDPFGLVRNRLTTPPFVIGQVSAAGVDALLAQDPTPGRTPGRRFPFHRR